MRTLRLLLMLFVPFLSGPTCNSQLPIPAFSGEEIHFRVSGDKAPPGFLHVHLYSGAGELIRTITTDEEGAFVVDGLTEGKYRLFVPGWGHANLDVVRWAESPVQDVNLPTFVFVRPEKPKTSIAIYGKSGSAKDAKKVRLITCPVLRAVPN